MIPDRNDIRAFGKWMGLVRDPVTGNVVGRKYVFRGRAYLLYDDGRTERWSWEKAKELQVLR